MFLLQKALREEHRTRTFIARGRALLIRAWGSTASKNRR